MFKNGAAVFRVRLGSEFRFGGDKFGQAILPHQCRISQNWGGGESRVFQEACFAINPEAMLTVARSSHYAGRGAGGECFRSGGCAMLMGRPHKGHTLVLGQNSRVRPALSHT